jgi:PilZ domain
MTMERRRRVARYKAGWNGFCHVEGESASGWRDCRVVDISMLGVGIRMQHLKPSELLGRRISVELPAVGESINIRLEGHVKHVVRTALRATVRIGIEFEGLSNTEKSILEALCGASDRSALALV